MSAHQSRWFSRHIGWLSHQIWRFPHQVRWFSRHIWCVFPQLLWLSMSAHEMWRRAVEAPPWDDRPLLTLKQMHNENGSVTMTMAQEIAVRSQPHRPMPASDSSAATKKGESEKVSLIEASALVLADSAWALANGPQAWLFETSSYSSCRPLTIFFYPRILILTDFTASCRERFFSTPPEHCRVPGKSTRWHCREKRQHLFLLCMRAFKKTHVFSTCLRSCSRSRSLCSSFNLFLLFLGVHFNCYMRSLSQKVAGPARPTVVMRPNISQHAKRAMN